MFPFHVPLLPLLPCPHSCCDPFLPSMFLLFDPVPPLVPFITLSHRGLDGSGLCDAVLVVRCCNVEIEFNVVSMTRGALHASGPRGPRGPRAALGPRVRGLRGVRGVRGVHGVRGLHGLPRRNTHPHVCRYHPCTSSPSQRH